MEQDSESIHDPKKCGGPGICLPCSTVDVVNRALAIKLVEANVPTIAQQLWGNEESIRYFIAESEACYLVVTPRDAPRVIIEELFHHEYKFVDGEITGQFCEVERR